MKITIRHEKSDEYKATESLAREAFWNLYIPGCQEHLVLHKIRKSKDFIPELSFVIEVYGVIVGGIFYTHSKIISPDKTVHKTISFGPVFIHPKFHRQGLGRKLITHSIEKAKEMGALAITTLGYPYHYEPYGFTSGKKYNISMADGKYYKGLLVLPLYEGALNGIFGYTTFADELCDVDEKELEQFDKQFPPKEKKIQDSQKKFAIACTALDE